MKKLWASPNLPLMITLLVLAALFTTASLMYEGFFSGRVVANLIGDNASLGIAAIGMTVVILAGGIDLSVGSVIGLAAVVSALVAKLTDNPALGLAAGLLAGASVGLINGFLYTRIKINPFIATLGMLSVARGAALLITGGLPIPFENWVAFLGSGRLAKETKLPGLCLRKASTPAGVTLVSVRYRSFKFGSAARVFSMASPVDV